MHSAISGDKTIPRNALLCHAKVGRAMRYELVRLLKRAFIEKKLDPLPRRKLSSLLLSLASLRTTALFGNSMPRGKLSKVVLMTIGLRCGSSLRNGMLGCSHRTKF